jgi:alpha-ketoglutarate-dependent taurine dioxygenase
MGFWRGPLVIVGFVVVSLFDPDRIIRLASRYDSADRLPPSTGGTTSWANKLKGIGLKYQLAASFVVVVSPADPTQPRDSEWLASVFRNNTDVFRTVLFEHGALIFRGFDVPDALSFETVALAINPELETVYLGTSPRSNINGTTYVHTAADFNPHRTVPTHIEMSFRDAPPQMQIFYASRMDQKIGGETPLTDFHGVWTTLQEQESFRIRYEDERVKYIRNNDDCSSTSKIDPLVQKCWQEMYKTDNRTAVLKACVAEKFECTWDERNRLTMTNVQPFVRRHPVSDKPIWFNHVNVLHKDSMALDYERTAVLWGGLYGLWPMALGIYYRSLFGMLSLFWPETALGSTTTFERGETIPPEDFYTIKRAIWRNSFHQPYEVQDVVVIDNLRVGHGREIYTGPKVARQVMTAWSDLYPALWVSNKITPSDATSAVQ